MARMSSIRGDAAEARSGERQQEGIPVRFLGVHPGLLFYSKIFLRLEPLGLELVAAAARRAGHEVRLIDLQVEDHRAYFRLIDEWRPDLVAFSCNYLAHVPEIVDLAKATKARHPESFICVGGHSASFTAEAILAHGEGAVDCVLKGEGEAGMLLLLRALEAGEISPLCRAPSPRRARGRRRISCIRSTNCGRRATCCATAASIFSAISTPAPRSSSRA